MKNGLGLFYFPDVEDDSFEVGGGEGYTARNEQCEDE